MLDMSDRRGDRSTVTVLLVRSFVGYELCWMLRGHQW